MKQLVFATGNPHKVLEVNQVLDGRFEILSLKDINCPEDLPETSATIEGNALQKARYVYENFGVNCFAEDTGLEIEALNGEPGIYSARYAGEERNPEANIRKVLQKLSFGSNRNARFKTIIALIIEGKEYTFEGIASGTIRHEKSGTGGFGYDPVFQPEGFDITFAEMPAAIKNTISHRGKAVHLLINFLKSLSG